MAGFWQLIRLIRCPTKPLSIIVHYESYQVIKHPGYPTQTKIFIPLGSRIFHCRGGHFVLTKEFLTNLKGTPPPHSAQNSGLEDGLYIPRRICKMKRWVQTDTHVDPFADDLPNEIRYENEKLNEEDKVVIIPATATFAVVLGGTVKRSCMKALTKVYTEALNSRQRFLDNLKTKGAVKRKPWADTKRELAELEVVRNEKAGGMRERKRKRVRYWAEGIDEDQVTKGRMKSRRAIEMDKERLLAVDEVEQELYLAEDLGMLGPRSHGEHQLCAAWRHISSLFCRIFDPRCGSGTHIYR